MQNSPAHADQRERIRARIRAHVGEGGLLPPLDLEELRQNADQVIAQDGLPASYRDFVTVLMGNAVWESTFATIPFSRRVLLLPQCLRSKDSCPAELDEFGLLCEECGRCPTGELQAEAEKLGYVVLIAEGTTVVTKLLQTGQVDAVVGMSCLSALERSFPYTAAAAIPGLAIPLLMDGCDSTGGDFGWVREAIHMASSGQWSGRLDLDTLRSTVSSWFDKDQLEALLQLTGTRTEAIACEWMITGGKRWRPFLAACVFQAVTGPNQEPPTAMKELAVAVECFHKASLVHDDIEDGDESRYGMATLHKRLGVPIALNIGDLLVGEGYRLISECCDATPAAKARMLAAAARAHRALCLGQGEELAWSHQPAPLTIEEVLEIFRLKTAPAFEFSLTLGAIFAGCNGEVCDVLKAFSDALGTAYQIRDDIEDFTGSDGDLTAMRPSVLLALAMAENDRGLNQQLARMFDCNSETCAAQIRETVARLRLEEKAWQMYEHYRSEAIRALRPLTNSDLKSLLFRIVHKILGDPPATSAARLAVHQKPIAQAPAEAVIAGQVAASVHG